MKKVLVIGSGGAGKSTFSRRLGEKLGLPVVHLDKLYWQPNWVEPSKNEWAETVKELLKNDFWIIDGNYGGTRDMRIEACDTIIFLNLPRYVCLYRVLKRAIQYRGKTRPDMAEGCNEKIDLEFVLWVWNYPNRTGKDLRGELARRPEKDIVVLRSTREADIFLNG